MRGSRVRSYHWAALGSSRPSIDNGGWIRPAARGGSSISTGALALWIFAVAPAHMQPYGWIASRHMLVAGVPAMFGVLAHVRAREEGWRPGRWVAPLAVGVGLLGGEAALGGLALWIAYDLAGPSTPGAWRARLLAALPAVAVAAAYLALYTWFGGGTAGI